MRTKEGKLTYRGLIVVGAAFMALNALVIALLYAAATRSGQAETYQLAEETASFLEDTCEKNETWTWATTQRCSRPSWTRPGGS